MVTLGSICQTVYQKIIVVPILSLWLLICEGYACYLWHGVPEYVTAVQQFAVEPMCAEHGLMSFRNMKLFLIPVNQQLFQMWWSYICTELWLSEAIGAISCSVCFAFKGVQVWGQLSYVFFSLNSAKLDYGGWADACERGEKKKKLEKLGYWKMGAQSSTAACFRTAFEKHKRGGGRQCEKCNEKWGKLWDFVFLYIIHRS